MDSSEQERAEREAARVMRHVNASNDKVVHIDPKPKNTHTGNWHIYLKKIPARFGGGKDCTVVLRVDGQEVFRSTEKDGITVNAVAQHPYGNATTSKIVLDIPVMGTSIDREFQVRDGEHVVFEANSQGLAIKQTTNSP